MDKAVGQTVTVVRVNPATGAETREVAQVLANTRQLMTHLDAEFAQAFGLADTR